MDILKTIQNIMDDIYLFNTEGVQAGQYSLYYYQSLGHILYISIQHDKSEDPTKFINDLSDIVHAHVEVIKQDTDFQSEQFNGINRCVGAVSFQIHL